MLLVPIRGRVRTLAEEYHRAGQVLRAEVHGGEGASERDTDA